VLANALVSVTLSTTGPSPITSITNQNGEVTTTDSLPFEAEIRNSAGACYSSALDDRRTARVLMTGPVCAVAEVCGKHGAEHGGSALAYRLRVRLIANQPVIILQYHFYHTDPGIEYHSLNSIAVRTGFDTGESINRYVHQRRYSMLSVPRDVETGDPVDIRVEAESVHVHVENDECLHDDTDYPEFMSPPLHDTAPYLGLALREGAVVMAVDDFRELCPKALVSRGQEIELQVWPEWAGTLKMHQGWSREVTLRLMLSNERSPLGAGTVNKYVDATTDTAKAQLPMAWYEGERCWLADTLLPKGGASPRRFDGYLTKLTSLPTVAGMWDLGDTLDPGYSRTYTYIDRLERYSLPIPARFPLGGESIRTRYYCPLHHEPVWANNEYDVILCLARECLRGGAAAELWRKLHWFARHAIEVDFIDYSDDPQLHHGSPAHSANHCKASSYPSHLWCEGLLLYYCLSGDDDALQVAVQTGDAILATFADPARRKKLWHFTREVGWALIYVAYLADITREKRFLDCTDEMADFLIAEPLTPELVETMVRYAFGYASIAMGIKALYNITGRKVLADWLVDLADRVTEHSSVGGMALNYVNTAYALTKDEKYIRAGMHSIECLLDSVSWYDPYLYTKQVAMSYRPLSRFLRFAHELGLLQELDYRF
jgi:hypothetical protein